MTPEVARALLGRRILDFELVDVLAAGGMNAVFKGRHHVTGQLVAIKVLPGAPDDAPGEMRRRFVDEAKVLARLEHPNIVGLNNFTGDEEGNLSLVMQLVEGTSFERMIEAGAVDPPEAVRVAVEVCKALAYAHEHAVVHRDIKPANVLVRARDGAVKVTDFGIAKILGAQSITQGGAVGTAVYISPEQVRGEPLDGRADLYALGATLYEALVGEAPFEGKSAVEILDQHLHATPVPPRARGAAVSAELEAVVMRALAKNRDDRYDDAAAMRAALEATPEGRGPLARSPDRRARRILLSGAAIGLLLLAAIAALLLHGGIHSR